MLPIAYQLGLERNLPKMETITSARNQKIIETAALKEKKFRDATGLFTVEGTRILAELVKHKSFKTERVFYCSELTKESEIAPIMDGLNAPELYKVSAEVFKKLSDAVTPQGVLAVCAKRNIARESLITDIFNGNLIKSSELDGNTLGETLLQNRRKKLILLLENVRDPGNIGTMLRIADAAGADFALLSEGCADVYSPKAVRAAAGAHFHISFAEGLAFSEVLPGLKQNGAGVYGAHLSGLSTVYEADLTQDCALLIGNEANGISEEAAGSCSGLVKIPMPGSAESLNAAIAAGIFVFEAVRQRNSL